MPTISYRDILHSWIAGKLDNRPYLDAEQLTKANLRLEFLLGKRRGRATLPPRDQSIVVYPGIETRINNEPNELYVRFLNHLRAKTLELGNATTERGMMVSPGIPGDLTQLLTLSGHGMSPYPSPDPFNEYRTEVSGFHKPAHESIAYELGRAMFGEWEPKHGFRLARHSTYGFPSWEFEIEYKIQRCETGMRQWSHIAALTEQGELRRLFDELEVIYAYHSTYRRQADSSPPSEDGTFVPKPRESYGYDFIIGKTSEPRIADKTISSVKHPAFRERVRQAYGMSGSINHPIGAWMSGFRDHYLETYDSTWKTRSSKDLEDELQGWHWVGIDVKAFDTNYPHFLMNFVIDRASANFPAMRAPLDAMMHAPTFSWRRGNDEPPFWTGDPLDPATFGTFMGLPSGCAPNPDFGKFGGTFGILALLDDFTSGEVEGRVDELLRWVHPTLRVKNSTDDMLVGFGGRDGEKRASAFHARLRELEALSVLEGGVYFKFEPEDPVTFLGNAIYTEGPARYRVEPSINSVLVNWHVPERSAGSSFRPFPGTGWFVREEHFAQSALFESVKEIRDRMFFHYFGRDVHDLMRAQQAMEELRFGDLTEEDKLLLVKPERLYYTDDAKDGGRVADTLSAKIDADFIRTSFAQFKQSN